MEKVTGRQKTAIVTGVTGQDGYIMAEKLLAKNYVVHGVVRRLSRPSEDVKLLQDQGMSVLHGDIADPVFVSGVIKDIQPDEFYNFAAMSYVWYSFKKPSRDLSR